MKFSELQIQQYDSHEYFLRMKLVVIKIRCIELLKSLSRVDFQSKFNTGFNILEFTFLYKK